MAEIIHVSDAEAARDFASLLAKVRPGVEIVIQHDMQAVAVLRAPLVPRMISDCMELLPENSTTIIDSDFAKDVEKANDISAPDYYKEVSNDHRFFGDLRFKQLTVWSVVIGALVNAMLSSNFTSSPIQHFILPGAGMIFTAIFWALEVRSTLKAVIARRKQKEFEQSSPRLEKLGSANWTFVNQTNALPILYALSYFVFWCVMFTYRGQMHWIAHFLVYLWIFPLPFLLTFTVSEYRPLWQHAKGKRN